MWHLPEVVLAQVNEARCQNIPLCKSTLVQFQALPGPFYHNLCMVVTKMATEETCRSRFPKRNRGINLSDEATEALLECGLKSPYKVLC